MVPVRKVTGGARADWSDAQSSDAQSSDAQSSDAQSSDAQSSDAQSEVGNRLIFAGRLEWSEDEG
jgi:hypothetical protein